MRLSSLGDIIVSGVFLPFLKECLKGCQIDWFVDSRFAAILEKSPMITHLYPLALRENLKAFRIKKLKNMALMLTNRECYDVLIDMQGLIKSAIIGKMIPTKHFVGFDLSSAKESLSALAYDVKVSIPYKEHILHRNAALILKALKLCGCEIQAGLEQMLQHRDKMFALARPSTPNIQKNALFIIESSLESKTYSAQNFILLGRRLLQDNIKISILVDKNHQKAQEIYEGLKKEAEVLPKMTLLQIRSLMQQVDVVIGGDTGITHLAWAMKRPSVTLYGNTPAARFSLDSPKNLFLTGSVNPRYNKHDFSINHIAPDEVYIMIEKVMR